jgi:hypothetical protein
MIKESAAVLASEAYLIVISEFDDKKAGRGKRL